MQVFEVLKSIETRKIMKAKIGDILSDEKVYLIGDDIGHIIYIYRGEKARLVLYFIATRLARDLRKLMRGFYQVQELTSETLIASIKEKPAEAVGKIPELYNPSLLDPQEFKKLPQSEDRKPIEIDPAWRNRMTPDMLPVFQSMDIEKMLILVDSLPIPQGISPKFLFLNTRFYQKQEHLLHFIGKREIAKKYAHVGFLSEGRMIFPEYQTRFMVKDGSIQFIELFRPDSLQTTQPLHLIGGVPDPQAYPTQSLTPLKEAFHLPSDDGFQAIITKHEPKT